MSEHTKGRLEAMLVGDTGGENPEPVYEIGNEHVRVAEYVTEANARRLVACWNACEGLETEAIEIADTFSRIMADAGSDRDRLLAENARLREALDYALRYGLTRDDVMTQATVAEGSAIANIRAALGAAK